MDTEEEASDYDAMDHAAVNRAFCEDALAALSRQKSRALDVLDLGTGTARIPIELCNMHPFVKVVATDLASHMLTLARANVAAAGLADRIVIARGDVKSDATERAFDLVLSNSVVHHIPDPVLLFQTAKSKVAPGGTLFIRDLSRPDTAAELQELVRRHAPIDASAVGATRQRAERQRVLFEASLHAALTLREVQALGRALGIPESAFKMTSDRHWTLAWTP